MNEDIRRKLNRITDALWAGGVTNPVTYIEQLSYLIFLKLLDEEESERELRSRLLQGDANNGNDKFLFPQQSARYRWSKWKFKSGVDLRDFLRDDVFPYMASLVRDEPRVSEYFRDAVLEVVDPAVLKQVIDEVDTIEFKKLGPDVKGDIFEYLLTHLGQSSLNGQFRTPRQIRAFMVEMVDPDFGDSFFDPACGTGGFLIDAVDYILAKYSENPVDVPIYGEEWLERRAQTLEEASLQVPNLQIYRKGPGDRLPDWQTLEASIFGIDVSRQLMRIAMMNLVLHGIRHANLKRANALSELGGLTEDDLNRRYSVVLSNPPFAGSFPRNLFGRTCRPNPRRANCSSLALMMKHLAPGGRCAVVLPEGVLFGSNKAHVDLRRKLVEDFDIRAVISLPAGVFKPYAGVKTAVVMFQRPSSDSVKRADNVWFYEVKNDGFDPDKIQGGGRPETPDRNDIPKLMAAWRQYKQSRFLVPPGAQAGFVLPPGSKQPSSWWAPLSLVAENEYALAASRYKPRISDVAVEESPVLLIRDALSQESQIQADLQKLLSELESES